MQNVAYTYDQGRDMLKASEIVLYKNPTFIGPTTGIMGLYHGAWWYYYLAFVFLVFGSSPISFYIAGFFVHAITLIGMYVFFERYFTKEIGIISALLVTISPYFIRSHVFIGNNILVLPFLAVFLGLQFILLEDSPKRIKIRFALFSLIGLALGFIAEFEFAFGLLLIPLYIILVFITPLRKHFFKLSSIFYFLGGLVFPFIPRLLFELKNGFSQTNTLFSFIHEPKLFTPRSLSEVVRERSSLILEYYQRIFPNTFLYILISVLLLCVGLYIVKNRKAMYKDFLMFLLLLMIGLYVFSTFYKDTFWDYYYEGFPYIYLALVATVLINIPKKVQKIVFPSLIIVLVFFMLRTSYASYKSQPRLDGLAKQQIVVDFITNNSLEKDVICLRVYTPPVISYTYEYLFQYNERKGTGLKTSNDWQNNTCWFIIEHDDFNKRQQDWIHQNLPKKGEIVLQEIVGDISIELWEAE